VFAAMKYFFDPDHTCRRFFSKRISSRAVFRLHAEAR
jgi:hypothetical protein